MKNKTNITINPEEVNVQIRDLMDRIKILENNNDDQRRIDIKRELKDLYAMVRVLQQKEELEPYIKKVF